jgi:hypothetical protein
MLLDNALPHAARQLLARSPLPPSFSTWLLPFFLSIHYPLLSTSNAGAALKQNAKKFVLP